MGGYVYRYFGLPYSTPTVGLYFYAEDYVRFVSDLRRYTQIPLKFIKAEQSNHYDELHRRNQLSVPIGKLDDVEIIFLHYKTQEEADCKWKRRVQRINFENLIIKFSQMNLATDEDINSFEQLDEYAKKFWFCNTKEKAENSKCGIYYHGYEHDCEIKNDSNFFNWYIDLYKLINNKRFPT